MGRCFAVCAAALALAACTPKVAVRTDQPGQDMRTDDPGRAVQAALSLGGGHPDWSYWTVIRVFAAPGTTLCRTGKDIREAGPRFEGKPDAAGVVLLTWRKVTPGIAGPPMRITCDGPVGETARAAPALAIRIHMQPRGQSTLVPRGTEGGAAFNVLQPVVHMNPRDPQAKEHWRIVREELCGNGREGPDFICVPGVMDQLEAQDVG